MPSPTTPRTRLQRRKNSPSCMLQSQALRPTFRARGPMTRSAGCPSASTKQGRRILRRFATRCSRSRVIREPRASTTSTSSAMAFTDTTSYATKRGPSSSTSTSSSRTDWRLRRRASRRLRPNSFQGTPIRMDFFLQLLFTGVGIGAVYALVALGFVLIFRATSVVNFAQGEFSMVAAYLMVVFAVDLGWPYWLSFLIAIAAMVVLGAIFNLTVYYPLRHRTFLPVLISTIGASIFLSNSVLALYGPQPQVLPGWLDTPGFQLGPVYLDSQYLLIIGVTLALVAFQYWLFERTLIGKKLQATSQDKEMATLLGIPVAGMIMITFVYSAVLGGIAGILVAPILFVSIQMGSTIALKAFAATIIGGFGDVAGAILAGFAIGIIETFGAAYISVPFKDAFAFLVVILFLIVRPQGIFGERVAEKA